MTESATPIWLRWESAAMALVVIVLAVAGFVAGHRSGTSAGPAATTDPVVRDAGAVAIRTALGPAAAIPGLARPPRRTSLRPAAAATNVPAAVTPVVTPPAAAVTPVVTPAPTPARAPAKPAPTKAGTTFDVSG